MISGYPVCYTASDRERGPLFAAVHCLQLYSTEGRSPCEGAQRHQRQRALPETRRAGHEPGAAKTDKARPSQTRPVWKERPEPERTFRGTCGKHQPLTQGGQPLWMCDAKAQQAPTSGGARGPSRRGAGTVRLEQQAAAGDKPALCRSPFPSEELGNANQGFTSACSMTKGLQGPRSV